MKQKQANKVNKRDSKKILILILILFGVAFTIVGSLPYLFTKWSIVDFTETGEIGDTIGGIMSPFISIIGALLTFAAFWVQYLANQKQFEIFNRQQEKENIDHVEKRIFFLIEHYFRLEGQLNHSGWTGKAAFGICLKEIKTIINIISIAIKDCYNIEEDFNSFNNHYKYAIISVSVDLWWTGLNKNKSEKQILLDILKEFNNITKIGDPESIEFEFAFYDDKPKLFSEFKNHIFNARQKRSLVVDFVEIHQLGISRSNQFSAYFKSIYSILSYINKVDSELLNFHSKKTWIHFFVNLLSDEEQELLAYVALSKVLWGLEVGPKENAMYFINKKDSEKVNLWANSILVSKYKIFQNLFNRQDPELSLEHLYFNHTLGGNIKELEFDYDYFENSWKDKQH